MGGIYTSVTWSKWNSSEMLGLKFIYHKYIHRKVFLFEIPPCGQKVIFVTEIVILGKNSLFYEAKLVPKLLAAWRDFKKDILWYLYSW